MLLLDWEKAFDKLTHKALFVSMEKMNINTKLINLVKMIYKQPEFIVEIEGKQSNWKPQTSGIRQGCPMSPYRFLIAMTTIFDDIKHEKTINKLLTKKRPVGAESYTQTTQY